MFSEPKKKLRRKARVLLSHLKTRYAYDFLLCYLHELSKSFLRFKELIVLITLHVAKQVIGDKKGGRTTRLLASNNNLLGNMSKTVNLPIKIIHVVRNPFDNIATMVLRKLKINRSREQLVKNPAS